MEEGSGGEENDHKPQDSELDAAYISLRSYLLIIHHNPSRLRRRIRMEADARPKTPKLTVQ